MNKEKLRLVWEEDFNGSELNKENWNALEWLPGVVNNEVQFYDGEKNCEVSNGTLKIRAVKNEKGEWHSGRITSCLKKSFKYGYIEAKIKLPEGNGVWPAFWMMPDPVLSADGKITEEGVYGKWPRSGEIDILEYSPCTFGNDVYGTIHYGTGTVDNETHFWKNLIRTELKNVTEEFHTYGVCWTENEICYYYDGVKSAEVYKREGKTDVEWPYDQKFHVILNLAMGGNLGGRIDESLKEAIFEIEYVKVWEFK